MLIIASGSAIAHTYRHLHSKPDVIQRTEDGFARDTTHTTPNGDTHTRSVDVSCDKDARKCVKQVEVGQQP